MCYTYILYVSYHYCNTCLAIVIGRLCCHGIIIVVGNHSLLVLGLVLWSCDISIKWITYKDMSVSCLFSILILAWWHQRDYEPSDLQSSSVEQLQDINITRLVEVLISITRSACLYVSVVPHESILYI